LHIPPSEPDAGWNPDSFTIPWWRDTEKYMIGRLTRRTRKIKLINMLTKHEDVLDVSIGFQGFNDYLGCF
jgi:hypothetical protein